MKEIRFAGYSDDILSVSGAFSDEIGCWDEGHVIVGLASESTEGQINIVAGYDFKARGKQNGCWSLGIMQVDEDVPVPDWPIAFCTAENGYSPELIIVVPDDTEMIRPD